MSCPAIGRRAAAVRYVGATMKNRITSLRALICAANLACLSVSLQAATLVGANDPALDLPALQSAANAGGHHLLMGTFDLGSAGRVVLTKDVEFEGGSGASGEAAVIRRGDWAFLSPLPFSTVIPSSLSPFALPPVPGPGPRIAIRNLEFDGPVGAAVHVAYASRLEVTGNRIRNVHRKQLTPSFSRHVGIDVGTHSFLIGALRTPTGDAGGPWYHLLATDGRRRQNSFVPGAVTGEVTIESNVVAIDPAEGDAAADADVNPATIAFRSQGFGIHLNLLDGATVRIVDNDVSGAARSGIVVLEPRYGPTGAGSVLIERNRVVTPRRGNYNPTNFAPNGIEAGWAFDPEAASDTARNAPVAIVDNRVEMNGRIEHIPVATGSQAIGIFADRVVVERNVVAATGAGQGGINALNSGILVRANRVEGQGLYALRAGTSVSPVQVPDTNPPRSIDSAASGNTFIGNNIAKFSPVRTGDWPNSSHLIAFKGASIAPESTTFVGHGNAEQVTVLDQGINTMITGYAPVRGGVGAAVREALTEAMPMRFW